MCTYRVMTIAMNQEARCEAFSTHGRRYVWHEGEHVQAPGAARLADRRHALAAAFTATVLPGLERRGAEHRVVGAGPRGGLARAHWVVWRAPGDRHPVWALYVLTRRLGDRSLWETAAVNHRPANDGALLVAWGDGPVMAWASDRPGCREVLREALRTVPDFLAGGLASADVTMPVRIVAA